jgi:hypothetical protein
MGILEKVIELDRGSPVKSSRASINTNSCKSKNRVAERVSAWGDPDQWGGIW